MGYTTLVYYAMVIVLLIVYYVVPKRHRWFVLLLGSIYFYTQVISSKRQLAVFLLSIYSELHNRINSAKDWILCERHDKACDSVCWDIAHSVSVDSCKDR